MELKDATLMLLTESAGYPVVASIAQAAYDQLAFDGGVDYRVLSDLIGEASGKGVLRLIRQKYSQAAFDAMIMPICREIGRQAPVRSPRRPAGTPEDDPLTASTWPPG
ncbi:MAG TPA: hypothetical protein VMR14_02050 [Streptosporangiaceae bacterium]|nr:hypothetical protein [Streptosporangiaceae bacterium]